MIRTGEHWILYVQDVLEALKQIASESVHCCVVSPPYWSQRDYGFPGQIGLEETPEEYIRVMVGVFREVHRVLRSDGILYLNLGDTYCKDSNSGLVQGSLVGIPWRVALALHGTTTGIVLNESETMTIFINGTKFSPGAYECSCLAHMWNTAKSDVMFLKPHWRILLDLMLSGI